LSQIFRSFEANSTAIHGVRAGNLAKLGFSEADHVNSDRLLVSRVKETAVDIEINTRQEA